MIPPPRVPWHITGNHWVTLPCIHPADASIHAIGAVHAGLRGAVEFAGDAGFLDGEGPALARITLSIDGEARQLGAEGLAWEREVGWIPTFSSRVGDVSIRGVICAPHGRNADVSGAVIEIVVENRGSGECVVEIGLEGALGHRQLRVRSPREFRDSHRVTRGAASSVVLDGRSAESPLAIAIGAGSGEETEVAIDDSATPSWSLRRRLTLASREAQTVAFHLAVAQERDGAEAVLSAMRRRGAPALIAATRTVLRRMEPATGSATADRLVSRHLFFAYFCSVARALDDAHVYVVRSRIPWNGRGMTIRDWEALMWVLPAVQLADQALAREVLLRICEVHGYAPGAGVHYLDGALFEPGFSLEGAAAYPIAVDGYIVQSGDDKVVEEPLLADSLYGAYEDIEAHRHENLPLFSTEVLTDGSVPEFAFTTHANSVVALALDILKHTLDEKTSEKVEDPAAVRAAVLRHFSVEGPGGKPVLAGASDLAGHTSPVDQPPAALYWLPYNDLIGRDDSIYRRTVKMLETRVPTSLEARCARIVGPGGSAALEWLRRAPLDGGIAAEEVDAEGRATGNGGDAALSGLIASTVWYAVHALGAKV
jgi:hypothetical protein